MSAQHFTRTYHRCHRETLPGNGRTDRFLGSADHHVMLPRTACGILYEPFGVHRSLTIRAYHGGIAAECEAHRILHERKCCIQCVAKYSYYRSSWRRDWHGSVGAACFTDPASHSCLSYGQRMVRFLFWILFDTRIHNAASHCTCVADVPAVRPR